MKTNIHGVLNMLPVRSAVSCIFVVLAALAQAAVAAPQWDFSDYKTSDPVQLFKIAYESDSPEEKLRIRSWLASKHPDRPEGLFARAWMDTHNKDLASASRRYQECVTLYPQFMPCLVNGLSRLVDEEKTGPVGEALLALDPAELDPDANVHVLANAYHYIVWGRKDKSAVSPFLAKYRARYPDSWVMDYVEGLSLEDKAPAKAASMYESAIAKAGRNIQPDVFVRLIGLETGPLYDSNKGSRLDVASARVVAYYVQTRNLKNDKLALYLVKTYGNSGASRVSLARQLVNFGVVPSSEMLDQVDTIAATSAPAWFAELRKKQESQARVDPTRNHWLGITAMGADDKPDEAVRRIRLAVDAAYSDNQRLEFARNLIWQLRRRGDCETADREARTMLGLHADLGRRADFYGMWFEAQLCTGDLAGARNSMNQRIALGNSASVLLSDEARLVMLQAERQQQQAGDSDSFLRGWQASSGGRLTLQIEFSTGSALVPARFEPLLKQVADTLKQSAAANYVFEVAGHTDNTGSAELNQQLSQKRAQAVVDLLIKRHGLSSLKLRASGYGPGLPMTENVSDAGRQRNRRVEITPVSSAAAPSIAVAGQPIWNPTLSNDGRLLLDGKSVLWDTRQWIALRQLPAHSNSAAFSRDGRYVIGLSKPAVKTMDTSIWVYELASNKVIARRLLGINAFAKSFSLSPDGKRLATVRDGYLDILELPTLKRQGVLQLSSQSARGVVTWVGNERVAAGVGQENGLQLVNANTLQIEKQLNDPEHPDYMHTAGTSTSGRYLVGSTNEGRLLVWDTQTWQRREIPREKWRRYSNEYRFHPLREQMVADQWMGSSGHTTVLVDLDTLKVSEPIAEGNGYLASYTPDGEHLYVHGSPMQKRNLRTGKSEPIGSPDGGAGSRPWNIDALNGGMLASYSSRGQMVWDVNTARPMHNLEWMGEVVFGARNQRWHQGKEGALELLDMQNFQTSTQGTVPTAYKDWSSSLTSDRWIYSRRVEIQEKGETRANEGELAIVDRQSGRELARHRYPLVTQDFRYTNDKYPMQSGASVALSPDGRYAAVNTWWREHWGYGYQKSRIVQVFDLQTGQRIRRKEMSEDVERLAFVPEQAGVLLITTTGLVNRYQVAQDTYGKAYPVSEDDRVLYDDGQHRIVRNAFYVTEIDANGRSRVLPVAGSIGGQALPQRNLLLLEFGRELRYYDLKTLTHQLTVVAQFGQDEWVAYTPDGHFSASPKGTEALYWSLGEATLPFSALKEKFNRPSVLQERLQSILQGDAVAVVPVQVVDSSVSAPSAAPAVQLDTAYFDPPFKVRVLEYPKTVTESSMTLKVGITKTRPSDLELAIELNVNGQQIEARGLSRLEGTGVSCTEGGALKVGCETVRSLPLSLEEGRNVVVVNAFFKGGRAQPEVIAIERKKSASASLRPQLWFFGVGVSEYPDPRNNLNFAHRDAEAIAAAFVAQEGKLYSKVNTKLLLNKAADARAIKSEMNRFLRLASSQDLIVIFLAGHGMQDNNQALYFMTADSNMAEPFTGLGVSEMQNFLRSRPMSQKAILLLDMCHAGAAGENQGRRGVPTGEELVNQLSNGTGVKIFAASQGQEFALENASFRGGHGAFTAALLEGLEGKGKTGSAGGYVSVLELELYVSRRVPEMTKGRQHPVTPPSGNNFLDYPLAVH